MQKNKKTNTNSPSVFSSDAFTNNSESDIRDDYEESGKSQNRLIKFSKALDLKNYAEVKENFNNTVNEIIDNSQNYNDASIKLYEWLNSLDQEMKWCFVTLLTPI